MAFLPWVAKTLAKIIPRENVTRTFFVLFDVSMDNPHLVFILGKTDHLHCTNFPW